MHGCDAPTNANAVSSEASDGPRGTQAASPQRPVKRRPGWLAPVAPSVRSLVLPERPTWPRSVSQQSGNVRSAWLGLRSRYVRVEGIARRVHARIGSRFVLPFLEGAEHRG
jgi:hypothetical protein